MAPSFFVDQNMLPVGWALAAVRDDVLHPGHDDLPQVPLGTKDPVWLPIVGAAGLDLVVLTRDGNIRRKPGELTLYRDHGVRSFTITGKRELSMWDKLRLVVRQWDRIEKAIRKNGPGPWAMALTEGGLSDIPVPRQRP